MYEKIMVPLDGSELAEVALPYAEGIASKLKAQLILLKVVQEPESIYGLSGDDIESRQAEAEQYLQRLAEGFTVRGLDVRSEVRLGHDASTIIDASEEEGADLIVIATHGRTGLVRWVLGSTADKVLHVTRKPVLLIRAKGEQPDVRQKGIFNRILVPLDGSRQGESVLPHVEDLASEFDSEIILFAAVPRESYVRPVGTEGQYEVVPYSDEVIQSLLADSREYLEKMKDHLGGKGLAVVTDVEAGDPAEGIIDKAEEHHANLVAMCTHGRSGVDRWAYGSVATKVLNAGTTPLLLVRVPEVRPQ
ncbi:MAG: universal stress protein [Dehalococcoidia bacterium]